LIRWLSNLIRLQEKREFHGETVVFFALFVGSMRLFLEMFLVGCQWDQTFRNFLLHVTFYLQCFFAFGLSIRLFAPPPWQARINVMLVALFLGFMPPVIDVIVSGWGNAVMGLQGFGYMYIRDFPEGWPWLMISSEKKVPIGEGAILWLAVAFTGLYIWIRTRSAWRVVASLFFAYFVCMLVGAIVPTTLAHLWSTYWPKRSFVGTIILGQIGFTLLLYLSLYRPSLLAHVFRRFVHAFPLIGLALVGYAWIKPLDDGAYAAISLVGLCGLLTIVQNDHWDDEVERPEETERVARYDVVIIQFAWLVVAMTLFAMESPVALLMVIYGVASFLYNAPLYRGKAYFPANLKLEGLWGGAAFLIGVFIAAVPELTKAAQARTIDSKIPRWMDASPFSWGYEGDVAIAAFLAFGGWSVLAALKDEKDVETDTRVGSQTVFTLLIRRGVPEATIALWGRGLALACLFVAAWAPLLIGRSSIVHALVMSGVAAGAMAWRGSDRSRGFRVTLLLVTLFLVVLAHGVSSAHA
jgi:hypothetical protein